MPSTRSMLAIIAIGLAAAGAWMWYAGDRTNGGIVLRVTLIAGAVWYAWPALAAASPRAFILTGGAVALMLFRPRSAWVLIPVLLAVVGSRRRKPTGQEEGGRRT